MSRNTFTSESEADRRALFAKATMEGTSVSAPGLSVQEYWYSQFRGILPVNLPDGTRILFIPDVHAPAHNERIMRMIYRFQEWYRPHIVTFVGDVNDLLAMSAWPKMPRTPLNAQEEIDETRRIIYKVVKLGALWVIVIDGNHEDRMIRQLSKLLPAAAHYLDADSREPVLNLPNLMGFQPNDPVTFITGRDERGGFEGGVLFNQDLKVEHGTMVKPTPGDSVRSHAEKWIRNTMTGHTHRMGSFARRLSGNKVLRGVELGCVIDWDRPNFAYSPGHDWHHGIGVGLVHNGVVHTQPIPITEQPDDKGRRRYFFTYAGQVWVSDNR